MAVVSAEYLPAGSVVFEALINHYQSLLPLPEPHPFEGRSGLRLCLPTNQRESFKRQCGIILYRLKEDLLIFFFLAI